MTNPKVCPLKGFFETTAVCEKEQCEWWIARQSYHHKTGCALKILASSMEIFVSEQKRFIMAMEKHR